MIKQHLKGLILRTRGGHAMTKILASLDEMDEETARQWYELMRNMKDDAEREGERNGAKQFWKHLR
jgi:hypothetical protein